MNLSLCWKKMHAIGSHVLLGMQSTEILMRACRIKEVSQQRQGFQIELYNDDCGWKFFVTNFKLFHIPVIFLKFLYMYRWKANKRNKCAWDIDEVKPDSMVTNDDIQSLKVCIWQKKNDNIFQVPILWFSKLNIHDYYLNIILTASIPSACLCVYYQWLLSQFVAYLISQCILNFWATNHCHTTFKKKKLWKLIKVLSCI